jgi:hypothetical protein
MFAINLTACGPEDSIKNQNEEQQREDFQNDKALLKKSVGTYVGYIINEELNKKYAARLVVKHVTILVTNPSSGTVTRIPSVGGDLVMLPENQDENETVLGIYTVGDFDNQNGELSLWSTSNVGTGGVSLFSFTGKITGNEIRGEVTTPYRNGLKFEGRRN